MFVQKETRINKLLSEQGICSRREADRLIEENRITVDGALPSPGQKLLGNHQIRIDGKIIESKVEENVLLLFYKPRGIVTSTKQQGRDITVTDYIKYPTRIYPIGRLDKDSEGLLLMTNQGELVNRILRARNHHEKEYEVTINCPVTDDFIRKMAGGLPILDTVTRPCKVCKTAENTFHIILTQGLNRQIRRMCEALGVKVTKLKRVRIMNLTLDGIAKGSYRKITQEEYKKLLSLLEREKE